MRPNTVYPPMTIVDKTPELKQCPACGVLLSGPLAGLYPMDGEARLIFLTPTQCRTAWCPDCRADHDRFMRELEETDEVYEGEAVAVE